jgi:ubiquinone/menaquinone biosynthesis C-methylase UbiE
VEPQSAWSFAMPSLRDTIDDLEFIASQEAEAAEAVYDRAAPRYEHFRKVWLQLAGKEAERSMSEVLRAVLFPGARVLDAGCGTGAMARMILDMEPGARLSLIDRSEQMLSRASDAAAPRVRGDVERLPFGDDCFDLVVSSWVIETLPDPRRAVQEYLRVLAPHGHVVYTFCSLPQGWLSRAGSFFLRKAVERGFAGHFIDAESTPYHDCDASRLERFRGGLTSLVVLRKCCTVHAAILPSIEAETGCAGAGRLLAE